jgi:hypothetical protein
VSPLELPLFPLSTVLFPGGTLGLRIFERRYLDMIASCSKGGTGFGVCLIRSGREAGEPAVPAAVGTLARIADFTLLDDGLLGITALGETAFRTQRTEVRDNGLLVGQVELRAEDPLLPVPPEFSLLATLLERLAGQLGGELKRAPKRRFDDAGWVGFRLAEQLPLELNERQQMLDEIDPRARLGMLAEWLPRFQREG